ncbi:MBL fold metallo-hydrolase [Clostridium cochlearium]|uniref:ComEC/Rec2 family competence protein n=1 Tax=Clostridium cochlearium TaxID=1494 RepID=UPI0014595C85|nr:ComEC/Rec2 family competence protein [Clostridium cochlearium]NME95306.1 MBL fold metallo-hydrolase [Clostridium cochlearium]
MLKNNSKTLKLLTIPILVLFILGLIFKLNLKVTADNNLDKNFVEIHFIDVGQGDCTLIKGNKINILIDSGSKLYKDKVISYLKKENIKEIDLLVATHPHEDHIGSMSYIIDKFKIKTFYAPKVKENTPCFYSMIKSLKNKNLKITPIKALDKINLSEDLKCIILAPNSSNYNSLNNYSIVMKISFKNNSFLFTGDAESISESEMLSKDLDLRADILKLGHHGSNTSSTEPFLKEVSPSIAIASCGKNNPFNHPSIKVVQRLKKENIQFFRTDIDGDIVIYSNGKNLIRVYK